VSEQPTMDFTAGNGHQAAPPTLIHVEPTPQPDSERTESLSDLTEADAYAESSGSRALGWSLAAVAVVIMVAAVIFVPRLQTRRAVSGGPPATAPVISPQEQPPANVEPPTSPPSQETAPPSNPTAVAEQAKAPKTAARHRAPDSSPRAPTKKVAEYEGLSEKDIPMLLRMAQNHAGAGKYEDARREFDIVLHLDPGNTEAKQGLRKLDLSERETR